MEPLDINKLFPDLDPGSLSFIPILDAFHEGVTITDVDGRVVYMNKAQARTDDIKVEYAIGKTVLELYRVDEGVSPTIQCLRTRTPVINLAAYYRTQLGRIVNSIHNVYPLMAGGELYGAIVFVSDYGLPNPQVTENSLSKITKQTLKSVIPVTARSHHFFDNGTRFTFEDIIGISPKFAQAVRSAQMASESPSPVMLYGETGTGKELFAQSIHNHSSRQPFPYIAVNCAAIPENLLEGILFGTTTGAFTGAVDKPGLIEQANGGTLFLDEVNSMAMGLQPKLLRVLQERKVRRVGSLSETEVDLKLISSVNQDPHISIKQGSLRPDLMYRLGVVFIAIPPLRERHKDIESLAHYFLYECNKLVNKNIQGFSREVMQLFESYSWPGNVRELEHVVEGAVNMVQESETIELHHLTVHLAGNALKKDQQAKEHPIRSPMESMNSTAPFEVDRHRSVSARQSLQKSHREFEQQSIIQALIQTDGNASHAARKLGISPQLMHYKLKRYDIQAKDYKPTASPPRI